MKRNLILITAALVLLALAAFFLVVPKVVDGQYNAVFHAPPYAASDKARELHQKLIVVDLHADSLLWDRDLMARNERGHVDLPRLLKGIAATGGVIGIGYWETAVCGRDARSIARAVRYTADLVGVEHVCLGSDFDGAVTTPFDTTGLVQITDALIAEGFGEEEIRMIMGGNAVRVLMQTLP